MRRRFLQGLFLLAAAAAFSMPVTAQAPDSWLGTWKLNVAKSKWDPASVTPKSQTVTQEAIAGGGMKSMADGVDWQGKTVHTEVTTMFDGKASEVTGAPDANTTRVYKRIDSRTYEFVTFVSGKVTTTTRSVGSADGKTRTVTATGKNAQGVAVTNTVVYERQSTALAQSSTPTNIGTWKLNLAKSTYAAGTAPKSATFTNEAVGGGVRTTADSVAADGTVRHSVYTVVYDGKDNPITGNSANGDTAAGTRVDANTVKFIYKKAGTVTITQTSVVSKDGKTYTITAKGTNALGQTINTVAVYDKQ